jgi:hypothetical protein
MLVTQIVPRCLQMIKTVHDFLPPRVQAVTDGWPGEVLVFFVIISIMLNFFLFLWNVWAHEGRQRKRHQRNGDKGKKKKVR